MQANVVRVVLASALMYPVIMVQMARADAPLPPPMKHELCSSSGRFCAVSDPATMETTIYSLAPDGSRQEHWVMPGWFRVLYVADDGEHVVTGYNGVNLLPIDYDPEEVLVSFYDRGRLLRSLTLRALVPDLSKLQRTISHVYWGHYLGFDADGYFVVELVDGRTMRFDVTTGEVIP